MSIISNNGLVRLKTADNPTPWRMKVNLRPVTLALLVLAIDLPTIPTFPAAPFSVSGFSAGGPEETDNGPRYRLGRRQSIVEFVMPPVTLERELEAPPPLVTMYSDPQLRAQYPPNPNAPTVQESLRQDFGDLVKFQYALKGPDEELLIRQARTDALMSLAGRVYFSDRILLSQDLLPKYFEQNGDRFIRSIKVSNRILEGGEPKFDLSLILDYDLMMSDLAEKRFIFRPALRPVFFTFLDQNIYGMPDTEQVGRQALEAVILDRNQRYAEGGLPSMENPDVDITRSAQAFLEARKAAQRNNVEVALAGTLTARPTDVVVPTTETDWRDDTLEVAVDTRVLAAPVAAHLPLDMLVQSLEEKLEERQAAGEREWWDVGAIEIEVPLDTMVLSDEDRARLEASGVTPMTVVPVDRIGLKRNYYKPYFYTSVRLNLALVRIDNGEILAEKTSLATAAGDTRMESLRTAITKASTEAGNTLIDRFLAVWPAKMGERADYTVLATAISPDEVEGLIQMIESSADDAQVYLRSLIGSTAVLTVNYPKGLEQLVRQIGLLEFPKLRLVNRERNALAYEKI